MTVAPPLALAPPPADDVALGPSFTLATELAAQCRVLALQFDLGDLDLPDPTSSPEDAMRLRAVAPLYFAAELESARLLPALEMFAGLWASGGIPADLGSLGAELARYYRERTQRFAATEREALFGRLFGKAYGPDFAVRNARNLAFEPLMTEFAASISDLRANAGYYGAGVADAVRVRTASTQLVANLAPRSGGLAAFATQPLLDELKFAVRVFRETAVQHALGTGSLWDAVRTVTTRYLQQDVDVAAHVERARSGIALLAWLAESFPMLEAGSVEAVDDAVVTNAVRWMQATLALHERNQPAQAPGFRR